MLTGIIAAVTCAAMIGLVFFKPNIKIGKVILSSYWLAPLTGALIMLIFGLVSPSQAVAGLTADNDVNPIKILVLFISMTLISIFLDNTGFFGYLAMAALKRSGQSQRSLMLMLYATVSVLTVFTSNDIIVLTFTPFICYFSKNAKIDPIPYLFCEFIAANTWSMSLVIGNPTNIYLAGIAGIDFMQYVKVMLLPTIAAGLVSLGVLLLLFSKKLSQPICHGEYLEVKLDKPLMLMGLISLFTCIVMMTVSSYTSIPMWIISLVCFLALYVAAFAYLVLNQRPFTPIITSLKRTPYEIVPFIISMFVIVLSLQAAGLTDGINCLLSSENNVFSYGAASFLSANLVNNIPMSVLFSSVIEPLTGATRLQALFASIAGSNIGAFLTPVGALAGIMWMGMLRSQGIKLSFGTFSKYGAAVALPSMLTVLTCLRFML